MKYMIIVNHPLYRDTPPMEAFGARDLNDLRDELRANGVRDSQIKVAKFGSFVENNGQTIEPEAK